jgi:hypothetical protein
VRARKSKTEREEQKTKSGNDDRGDDTTRKNSKLFIRLAKKWRSDKEEIDRQVGNDEQWNERNRPFPLKIEHPNVAALRRDPIAPTVNNKEEQRQPSGNSQGLTKPWSQIRSIYGVVE